MPIYDYLCAACGPFDALRTLRERAQAPCPGCRQPAPQVLMHAPRLGLMSGAQRLAHARNEQAQHAPRSSREGDAEGRYRRLGHGGGCACCTPGARRGSGSAGGTLPGNGPTTSARRVRQSSHNRPWMISH
ncbi:MAG: zinc ribbon domain-containing protein [Lautropia sp.]|nr:zinc ribbon domain-containing protein [Lautropia sp.]